MSLSSFTTLETHFWKIKNGFILRIKNLRKLWLDSKQSSTYQPEVNFLENILFCRIQRGFFVTNYYNWAKLFVQCLQWAIGLFEVCTGKKKLLFWEWNLSTDFAIFMLQMQQDHGDEKGDFLTFSRFSRSDTFRW